MHVLDSAVILYDGRKPPGHNSINLGGARQCSKSENDKYCVPSGTNRPVEKGKLAIRSRNVPYRRRAN